ncbi:MAG TPA: IclR family transcriptional regulator C-terminal domain-containing protein [Vineibacter sp.]|nr:IclR family transcriptional regulator C-terminal domain-containing protein [Vineibacter sp.]
MSAVLELDRPRAEQGKRRLAARRQQQDSARYFVQALARGLAAIEVFHEARALTLSDVAKRAGITRATARRLLLTLCDLGYAATDGKYFTLRPRALRLGYAYLSSMGWSEVALTHLRELAEIHGETCSVSVLDGHDITFAVRVPASRHGVMLVPVGGRLPAYCTSPGRILLGGLPSNELDAYFATAVMRPLTKHTVCTPAGVRKLVEQARRDGYAFTDEELDYGVNCIAVPIRDTSGAMIAALNLSAPSSRLRRREAVGKMLPDVREAARNIEMAIRNLFLSSPAERERKGPIVRSTMGR